MKKTISNSVETAQARAKRWHDLQAGGMTAVEIAEKEGGGVTRSAVLGAIHRYRKANGIKAPGLDTGDARRARCAEQFNPSFKTVRSTREGEAGFGPSLFAASYEDQVLRNLCRFIIGDPKDKAHVKFCGHERRAGSSWCAGHHPVCLVKSEMKPVKVYE